MLNLIPQVKNLEIKPGFISKKSICYENQNCDERITEALKALPFDKCGVKVEIFVSNEHGEAYELSIDENSINIKAEGNEGAFYAVQTLKQIFKHDEIPCLYIKDRPDFKYRGFYHDVTRGKIPTVETIKTLIDKMAYYKLNSLQLYVEHTYEFKECKSENEKFGCLTGDEIKEIDAYCKKNFIDFIPSLSTFGHLYELLNSEEFGDLRVLKDSDEVNFWHARMRHHTIDPLKNESFELVKSLINQYIPNFESDYFNICCDETFDLKEYEKSGYDVGKIYVDFVKKIIDFVRQKGKNVMMWADILLQHPETMADLPENMCFLNWDYSAEPGEANIKKIADEGKPQIVCPGTGTWSRLCENVANEEKNISLMAEYGCKYGALGVLNTNWGDWGNPCSLELAMYGMVLGAEKSWSVKTEINDEFYKKINYLLYMNENGIQYLKELSDLHNAVSWNLFANNYFKSRYGFDNADGYADCLFAEIEAVQEAFERFSRKLERENPENNEYLQEMLISAEGICVIAELSHKFMGKSINRITDTFEWLEKYKKKWLAKNKASELYRIEEMFEYVEHLQSNT